MDDSIEKYNKKILNYYDDNGLLKQYPSKRPLRILALQEIAAHFNKEQTYSEKEVNEIIKQNITFSDYEIIRRELYEYKLLDRLKDGSKYWVNQGSVKGFVNQLEENQLNNHYDE